MKKRKGSKASGGSNQYFATPKPSTRTDDCNPELEVKNSKLSLFKGGISKLNMRIKKQREGIDEREEM